MDSLECIDKDVSWIHFHNMRSHMTNDVHVDTFSPSHVSVKIYKTIYTIDFLGYLDDPAIILG